MSDWEWKTLGDIASSESYGLVDGPFGSNLPASCYLDSGIPVIRGSNLTLGSDRFVANEFVYVSEETASRLERSLARPNDILFTKKGTIGQTGLVPSHLPYDVYLISSNQMKLTVSESLADPTFVYYYVSSKASQNKIKKDSEFTGVPKTNTKYLREFPIYLPPLQQQQEIAKILDTLDRKIENLRKQNETLEAIAQTLFKHWFIDFEFPNADGKPYKSSGGAMEPSELGEIPAGWRIGKLGDLFTLSYGKSLTLETRIPGQYPVIGSSGIVGSHQHYLVKAPGIVIGRKGTIGKVIWLEENFYPIDTTFYVEDVLGCDALYFHYFLLKRQNFQRLTSDSAVPGLNRDMAYSIEIAIPEIKLIENFNAFAKSTFNKMNLNQRQIESLTKTRDALLPKLMSGQLRLPED